MFRESSGFFDIVILYDYGGSNIICSSRGTVRDAVIREKDILAMNVYARKMAIALFGLLFLFGCQAIDPETVTSQISESHRLMSLDGVVFTHHSGFVENLGTNRQIHIAHWSYYSDDVLAAHLTARTFFSKKHFDQYLQSLFGIERIEGLTEDEMRRYSPLGHSIIISGIDDDDFEVAFPACQTILNFELYVQDELEIDYFLPLLVNIKDEIAKTC